MANHAKIRQAAEEVWLHYFNRELRRINLISHAQHDKLVVKIQMRKSHPICKRKSC